MAEEKINRPVTPNRAKRDNINPRRNSIVTLSSSSLRSNQLRASSGSCHESCKHGKPHSCEPKARHPLGRKKLVKNPNNDKDILVKSLVFPDNKKDSPLNRPKFRLGSQIPVFNAADVRLIQKGVNSDMRDRLKPSLIPSLHSVNAKKPEKTDIFSTNGASERSRPKPKERRLPESPIAALKPSSLPLRRLSSPEPSLLKFQMKPREFVGTHKRVAVKNVPRTTMAKRILLDEAKRIGKEVKDVEVEMVSSREETVEKSRDLANVEERLNGGEETESKATESEGIDECISANLEETERETSKKGLQIVNVEERVNGEEETESKAFETEIFDENTIMNFGETERKASEPECIDKNSIVDLEETERKTTVNFEETESKASELESIDECLIADLEEIERETTEKGLQVVSVEERLNGGGETESKASEPESTAEHFIANVNETERKPSEEAADLDIVESSIDLVNFEENDGTDDDFVNAKDIGESVSRDLLVSETESNSSLSPPDYLPSSSTQEEDRVESEADFSASEYEEGSEPWKVCFRRGRTVNVQHGNSNSSGRLRFRRGSLPGKSRNVNHERGRTHLKRTEKIEGQSYNGGKEEGAVMVFLRHNEVQERKDLKGLFNIVIEETASKLAEIRKSKVMALVGAFETVISLQDTNLSAARK